MKFISHTLVHPDNHTKIDVDWQNHIILMEEDAHYKGGFRQEVPFVLPTRSAIRSSARIHKEYTTEFYYQDHYQRDAEVFDYFQEFTSRVDQAEKDRLSEMIVSRIPPGATSILDAGCGNGWLAEAVVSDTTTVISMDISSRNPLEAMKRFPHPRHEALIADVYHLPLKENSFDCIVASEIMEHVPDPALFIKKLLYVLKPEGKLIITTPYDEQIQYHLCVHCNQPTPSHAHLHSFNKNNITNVIPDESGSWKCSTFSHKYMSKSRLYLMMKGLPFRLWEGVDQLVNKIWSRPMRLMLEVVKA